MELNKSCTIMFQYRNVLSFSEHSQLSSVGTDAQDFPIR